jgi:hypothetical protein
VKRTGYATAERTGRFVRIAYRPRENTLRLTLDADPGSSVRTIEIDGCIDIADQGRLVGIELDAHGRDFSKMLSLWQADTVARQYLELDDRGVYVALSAPSETIDEQLIRTAELRLTVELDSSDRLTAIAIPRRGHGYEISFPSGNQ